MALTVRKAKLSDIPALISLWRELSEHHATLGSRHSKLALHLRPRRDAARVFSKWVRKQIRSTNGVVYLALSGHEPVGYSLIFIKSNPFNSRVRKLGLIDHLLVKKGFRGRRISSALRRHAVAWFRRKRIRHLSLFVLERNRAPQAIYRKWGFFPFVIEMRKNL